MTTQKDDYQFFIDNHSDFVSKYLGKYIVIKEKNVLGVYNDMMEAINATLKNHELGSFIVQLCTLDEKNNTQVYHSRVSFL